ncbi:MAG: hypothetical protein EPN82_00835 [Bacteroidetes bacterium]|nr:MAG: hypothetical protein EPN82_00835 [Bacteroidota bacterium]
MEKIELINSVFDKLGIPRLLENPDFVLGEFTRDLIAFFCFNKENCIGMNIDCDNEGILFGLDPEYEAYYLSNDFINENKEFCLGLIEDIFKCTIKREVCGKKYVKFYFYNENGECVRTKKITGLFYLKRNCVIEEFPPIYLQYK